jgi:hypothetical protein
VVVTDMVITDMVITDMVIAPSRSVSHSLLGATGQTVVKPPTSGQTVVKRWSNGGHQGSPVTRCRRWVVSGHADGAVRVADMLSGRVAWEYAGRHEGQVRGRGGEHRAKDRTPGGLYLEG